MILGILQEGKADVKIFSVCLYVQYLIVSVGWYGGG